MTQDLKKTSRSTDNRSFDEREHSERESFDDAYNGDLDLPETVQAPDGMMYAWIAESVQNVPQYSTMQQALRRKYRPVPADRHPELCLKYVKELYGNSDKSDDRIVIGGLCLMERPQTVHEREQKVYQSRMEERKNSVSWTNPEHQDPLMPQYTQVNKSQFQSFGK